MDSASRSKPLTHLGCLSTTRKAIRATSHSLNQLQEYFYYVAAHKLLAPCHKSATTRTEELIRATSAATSHLPHTHESTHPQVLTVLVATKFLSEVDWAYPFPESVACTANADTSTHTRRPTATARHSFGDPRRPTHRKVPTGTY